MTDISPSSEGQLELKNVLDQSRSPYVRGHMNNPVAWQMWEDDALALAKKHNRLLFVSIGYAACHWCHVMERESFENDAVAAVLNKSFIPIKIDREERPDIDRIYMQYVQAASGRGGWPLNVFLTPDLEPVFGGTYFPGPESSMAAAGNTSFLELLHKVQDIWENQRERCLLSAKTVTAQLREFAQEGNLGAKGSTQDADDSSLDLELLEEAYKHFASKYDTAHAGFGRAPKFPTPSNLSFLLSLGQYPGTVKDVVGREECEHAKNMVLTTLRNMTRGGIHDQVGHGFARYSVTRDWSLPHFEKMLYDQAQLLNVYLDAFLVTGDAEMLGAVYDIATYLTEPPMAAPNGGFFSSEDADSYFRVGDPEKREGAFYVFTRREFESILGERDAEICARFWNVKENGNVASEFDAHDELVNQNVLAIVSSPELLSKEFGLPKDEVVKILREGRQKLLAHRDAERMRPDLDDKIVAGWNGIAIGALARKCSVLSAVDPAKAKDCRDAAIKAAAFIKAELFDPATGRLKRVYRDGPGDAPAFADDYAYLIQGLIELYEATFDDSYLEFADTLQKTQNALFHDPANGGFFSTPASQPDALLRLKDAHDAAEPSTNGVTAANLYRLSSFFNDDAYAALARATVDAFAAELGEHPFLFGSLMSALVARRLGVRSIVVTGPPGVAAVGLAVRTLRARLKMNTTVVRLAGEGDADGGAGAGADADAEDGAKSAWLVQRNPLLGAMRRDKTALMVCADGACREEANMEEVGRVLSWE